MEEEKRVEKKKVVGEKRREKFSEQIKFERKPSIKSTFMSLLIKKQQRRDNSDSEQTPDCYSQSVTCIVISIIYSRGHCGATQTCEALSVKLQGECQYFLQLVPDWC